MIRAEALAGSAIWLIFQSLTARFAQRFPGADFPRMQFLIIVFLAFMALDHVPLRRSCFAADEA